MKAIGSGRRTRNPQAQAPGGDLAERRRRPGCKARTQVRSPQRAFEAGAVDLAVALRETLVADREQRALDRNQQVELRPLACAGCRYFPRSIPERGCRVDRDVKRSLGDRCISTICPRALNAELNRLRDA